MRTIKITITILFTILFTKQLQAQEKFESSFTIGYHMTKNDINIETLPIFNALRIWTEAFAGPLSDDEFVEKLNFPNLNLSPQARFKVRYNILDPISVAGCVSNGGFSPKFVSFYGEVSLKIPFDIGINGKGNIRASGRYVVDRSYGTPYLIRSTRIEPNVRQIQRAMEVFLEDDDESLGSQTSKLLVISGDYNIPIGRSGVSFLANAEYILDLETRDNGGTWGGFRAELGVLKYF